MRYRLAYLAVAVLSVFATSQTGFCTPTQTFEDGTLEGWIVGGRQQGSNSWGVEDHGGSKMAKLSHTGFTELELSKRYDYVPNMEFSFDAEFIINGDNSPQAVGSSNFYSKAAYYFGFFDENEDSLGWYGWAAATSSHPYGVPPAGDMEFQPDGLQHYTHRMTDIAQILGINLNDVASVDLSFRGYSSWYSGHNITIYFDNVATLELLSGDLDGDGFVGLSDLDIILNNWNQFVTPGSPGDVAGVGGNPVPDGFVGLDDLDVVLGNWNGGTPPPSADALSIPEPAALAILLPGAFAMMQVRRRKQH